jgi:hypothetical protein
LRIKNINQTTCYMKINSKLVSSPGYVRFCLLLVLSLLFSSFNNAQTVTGTVTDAANQPVSGATVTFKGTARATTTDNVGKFSINAVNTSNVQAAIARQGADNLETRVWWDKP